MGVALPAAQAGLHQLTVPQRTLDQDDRDHLLKLAARQELPGSVLYEALAADSSVALSGRYERVALRTAVSTVALAIGCGVAVYNLFTPAAGAVLPFVPLATVAVGLLLMRSNGKELAKLRGAVATRFDESFKAEPLVWGYQFLHVEQKPELAIPQFQTVLEGEYPSDTKARALLSLVSILSVSKTPECFKGALSAVHRYILSLPASERMTSPVPQFSIAEAIRLVAERMHSTRYDKATASSGEHPHVNPTNVKMFIELFRSSAVLRPLVIQTTMGLPEELLRTVGQQSVEVRVALAELKGVVESSVVPGPSADRTTSFDAS
jgi:hypothetical protein